MTDCRTYAAADRARSACQNWPAGQGCSSDAISQSRSSRLDRGRSSRSGFTLIELLVAIAIFAVLSALGWKIFDYLAKVKARNSQHEQYLEQLQDAYQQIQRDTLQAVPIVANQAGQLEAAMQLDNQRLSFSKTGVSDPLKQGLPPDERIEYRYNADEKTLYRLKYRHLNSTRGEQPLSSVLLNQVDQYQIVVLNPDALPKWPNAAMNLYEQGANPRLPRGIKVSFSQRDVAYEWVFSLLNTDFVEATRPPQANNPQQPAPATPEDNP